MKTFTGRLFLKRPHLAWDSEGDGSDGLRFNIQLSDTRGSLSAIFSFLSDEDKEWLKLSSQQTHWIVDADKLKSRFSLESLTWLHGQIQVSPRCTYDAYVFILLP